MCIIACFKKKKKKTLLEGFPGGSDGKESACDVGDLGLIPGLGRSPGGRHSNLSHYSCLENSHGQRSLLSYSLRSLKELDTTEQLSTARQLIYNIVLVSGVQQHDSVIHIHIFILFQILFSQRLSQNVELSSLYYTVGPCWLSISYIEVVVIVAVVDQLLSNVQLFVTQ